MGTAIFHDDKCPNCGSDKVFVELNCSTQEYAQYCAACGSYESFFFRYHANRLVQKTTVLPLDKVALTVRICSSDGGTDAVVWDAPLPAGADTEFIEHYLGHRHEELKRSHPQFAGPDLEALEKQHGGSALCCVEKRLDRPSSWDGQPYLCLSCIGSGLAIQEEHGQPVFLCRRARYKYRHSTGCGVIHIEDAAGATTYRRVFSRGTTEERALRLWAAHTGERTNYERSYMTLIADGKLRLLKGAKPII